MSKEWEHLAFAQIDVDNKVVNRLIVSERNCLDENEDFSEAVGAAYMNGLVGGRWLLTEIGGSRKGYAGIGVFYDESRNAFIEPQPFPSWTLNEETCQWEPPVPYPVVNSDEVLKKWDESSQEWV